MTSTCAAKGNAVRGPFNAMFFSIMDGYLNWLLEPHKQALFDGLPERIVELGPGVGANFRFLAPGSEVIAIEPNPAMHVRLQARAAQRGIRLDLRSIEGERMDVADSSVDAVISSLVLCTVADPAQVLKEVKRVLRPGGRYAFLEHVAAPADSVLRKLQHGVRRPWAWCFEGCSCERDLATTLGEAGFATVELEHYRIRSPFLPFNTQVAGVARKAS